MRVAWAVVISLGAVGLACGSGGGAADGSIADAPGSDAPVADGSATDAPLAADGGPADGAVADAGEADAAPACGCTSGEYCDTAGMCQTSPAPVGGLCAQTATCKLGDGGYPSCLDQQCASARCAAAGGDGLVLDRHVCTRSCTIYQDDDFDNVNDVDAPASDCQPPEIFDGAAGTSYRCVNHAPPASSPAGFCLPVTTFAACNANRDCSAGETCDLTSMGGELTLHCIAGYRANAAWSGTVVRLGQTCNDDLGQGAIVYCADGPCTDGVCSAYCSTDADCDTSAVTPGQRCLVDTCENDASISCSVDADCSTAECGGSVDLGGGAVFSYCTLKP